MVSKTIKKAREDNQDPRAATAIQAEGRETHSKGIAQRLSQRKSSPRNPAQVA